MTDRLNMSVFLPQLKIIRKIRHHKMKLPATNRVIYESDFQKKGLLGKTKAEYSKAAADYFRKQTNKLTDQLLLAALLFHQHHS